MPVSRDNGLNGLRSYRDSRELAAGPEPKAEAEAEPEAEAEAEPEAEAEAEAEVGGGRR
jgi:hypothetical protein